MQGEPEGVQEMPAPESAPGSLQAANLIITVQDEARRDGGSSPSSATNEPVLQYDASLKEDAGEDTALLEEGRNDLRGGPSPAALPLTVARTEL